MYRTAGSLGAAVLDFAAALLGAASERVRPSERVLALELVLASEVDRVFALTTVSEAVVLEAAGSQAVDLAAVDSVVVGEDSVVIVTE